jgi:pimeloyl-ACP methyl ester carboxylesterase
LVHVRFGSFATETAGFACRWTATERGGHFTAMEQPDALARAIRAFFKPYREQA